MSNALASFSEELTRLVGAAEPYIVSLEGRRHSYASGIVWRPGVVVTAEHIIAGADQVPALLPDGKTATATVAGRDPGTDLAVLKLETEAPAVSNRTADGIRPGALVISVGRAPEIGTLATMGIVSGVRGNWRTWRGGSIDRYIRLDMGMYQGSSGAALFDAEGRVLGMATTALSRTAGVAIPNATLDRVVDQILAKGHVTRAWLGVGLQPVKSGLMIISLEEQGPAEKSGLLLGDIVVAINGRGIDDVSDVQDLLEGRVGEEIPFRVLRGGEPREVKVTAGERKPRSSDVRHR